MTLASFFSWAGWFESYWSKTPEDRFSRDVAHVLDQMSQLMRLWHLSHRRPAKVQASLRIHAVSMHKLTRAFAVRTHKV